jgi:SMI1/KNR4 family protein SUKH-1
MFQRVVVNCERFGDTIRRLGGVAPPLRVGPPATETEVVEVEARMGRKIPPALRSVLLKYARCFEFEWQRDHFPAFPHPWNHASEGRCLWSLDLLPVLNADLGEWRKSVYSDSGDPYAQHWHGVFAVCATGLSDGTSSSTDFSGGDFFGIKEEISLGQPVVFLSHDGFTPLNGRRLADNFEDFLLRWSAIGCVGGASGWALEYFITDSQGGIHPSGEAAVRLRELLGVELA